MGNLHRFVDPVLLFLLKKKGSVRGDELAADIQEHSLTDASTEAAALYKTLRQLGQNDCVTSEWDVSAKGRQNESAGSHATGRRTCWSGWRCSTTWPAR